VNPEDEWGRIDLALNELLGLPVPARESSLRELEMSDPALAARLRSLLGNLQAGDLLDSIAAAGLSANALASISGLSGGDRLNDWTLTEPIGSGGMAEVFAAERWINGALQRAAIKVMALGMDGLGQRSRFQRETAILAQLNDPRLSRLIDAGTAPDGRPWLAMEYVEGERLDRACNRLGLGIESRVQLVIEICKAVDHAHRQLVIHRDLKPSNILLTSDRHVRVLDFGIARVIDEHGDEETTRTLGQAFTLSYASPEQLQNQPTGVASDVYQLGLVLYWLLTDSLPWAHAGGDLIKRLRQMNETPALPSQQMTLAPASVLQERSSTRRRLQHRLRGDLDSIVMHALEFRPESRYPGARELANDLQRWLDGLPIMVRRYSTAYRLSRYLRRHWLGAGAIGLICVLGIGYAVQTTLHAVRLAEERNQAEVARQRAESMQQFLLDVFGSVDPQLQESRGKSVDQLLIEGVARAQASFSDQPLLAAQVLVDMGDVLRRRGRFNDAIGALRTALALRENALGPAHPDAVATLPSLGDALFKNGQRDEAMAILRRNLDAVAQRDNQASAAMVEALRALGGVESVHGDIQVAEQRLRMAIEMHQALNPDLAVDAALLAAQLDNQLAAILLRDRRFEEAEPILASSYAVQAAILGPLDQRTHEVRKNWAFVLRMLKRAEAAERELTALLEDERSLYQGPHIHIAYTLGHLANLASDRQDYEKAIQLWQQAEAEARAALGDQHPWVTTSQMGAARSMLLIGRREEGRAILQRIAAMTGRQDDTAELAEEVLQRYDRD